MRRTVLRVCLPKVFVFGFRLLLGSQNKARKYAKIKTYQKLHVPLERKPERRFAEEAIVIGVSKLSPDNWFAIFIFSGIQCTHIPSIIRGESLIRQQPLFCGKSERPHWLFREQAWSESIARNVHTYILRQSSYAAFIVMQEDAFPKADGTLAYAFQKLPPSARDRAEKNPTKENVCCRRGPPPYESPRWSRMGILASLLCFVSF